MKTYLASWLQAKNDAKYLGRIGLLEDRSRLAFLMYRSKPISLCQIKRSMVQDLT